MAKLNVVIPSVDVEIDGVKYRKVDRKAEVGDAIKITDNDGIDDVVEGGFYAVTEVDSWDDPQIIDEAGDDLDCHGMEYEVYEKVAESAAQQYREVKRPAKVGERIRIVELWPSKSRYRVGAEFVVDKVRNMDGYVWVNSLGEKVIALSEYVVLEPVEPAQLKRLTVGDYAKVIANEVSHNYKIGSFVKITTDDHDHQPYRAEKADGNNGNWLSESDVEPATEAEFLAQKTLKVGDYVKVIDANNRDGSFRGDTKIGEIREIIEDDKSHLPFRTNLLSGGGTAWFRAEAIVRATEAEVAAAKQAVKVGEFADGGYAVITDVTNSISLAGFKNGDYVTVSTSTPGAYALIVKTLRGNVGYCDADALRKVTKEEYEAATDPRNKFAKGDKVRLISGGQGTGLFGFNNGSIYVVDDPKTRNWESKRVRIKYMGGSVGGYAKPEHLEKVSAEEIAEIERKALLAQFKAGDSVKFVVPEGEPAKYGRADVKFGEIGTVDRVTETLVKVTFPSYGSEFSADPTELSKVSVEEAKWSAIGRKFGEFKAGDLVEIIKHESGDNVGTIVEVARAGKMGVDYASKRLNGVYFGASNSAIKLIVPAEHRFDREEKAA